MKYKVMYLLNHLKMGGAETLVTEYATQINKNMFDIVLVTVLEQSNSLNEKKLEEKGIRVIFLGDKVPFSNSKNIMKRLVNKIYKYILFYKVVKNEKPNIIHTHLGTNKYLVPINTKKKNIKLFHTIHSEIKAMFKKKTQIIATKYCLKQKNMQIIVLDSKMQKKANEFFNITSSIVIPNTIDLRRFANPTVNKNEMYKSLNINENAFVIGHVGRFTGVKNHEFLVRVFASVKQRIDDAQLILIGKGPLEVEVKKLVEQLGLQNSVILLGNRQDIPELMSIMDVFVLPSLYEGFPMVLIEAQAAGVKTIVSDSITSDAFITNLVTPISLDNTIDTWAKTIEKRELPNKIVGDLSKHDINKVIKMLENLYDKSIN